MPLDIRAPDGSIARFPDGTSDDDIVRVMKENFGAAEQSGPSTSMDVLKSTGAGLARGAIAIPGLPGDVESLARKGINYFAGEDTLSPDTALPTSGELTERVERKVGKFYEPQTTAGKYAETISSFAPMGLALGPAGLARRAVMNVALPGAGSEAAGQLTEGTSAEPYARVAGALAGAVAPGVASRLVTPLTTTPERAAASANLAQEGVTATTAGQRTGYRPLQYMESSLGDLPGAGAQSTGRMGQQAEQFTQAALRRVGEDATRATPEVIDGAFQRIGQEFDALAARTMAQADAQFTHDLGNITLAYENVVPASQRAPIVENLVRDLDPAVSGVAQVSGDQYRAIRSLIDRTARGTASPELGHALRGIRDALDDLMARYMPPDDVVAWAEARRQYRDMLVIERAATGAGEAAASGIITPASLRSATAALHGRRNYARGQGDFADLARSGVEVMTPLPQSGTAPRAAAGAIPAIAGYAAFGEPGALAGAVVGAAAPAATGRALMSAPVQAYLSNQLWANRPNIQGGARTTRAMAPSIIGEGRDQPDLSGNATYQYLFDKGVDPTEAAAVMKDPARLQELLLQLRVPNGQ